MEPVPARPAVARTLLPGLLIVYALGVTAALALRRGAPDPAPAAPWNQPVEVRPAPPTSASPEREAAYTEPYRSTAWGWSLPALEAPWRAWPDAQAAHPAVELGLLHGTGGGLLVVPVWLGELDPPPPEALLTALGVALDLPRSDAWPRRLGPAERPWGWELALTAPLGQGTTRHLLRVLLAPQRAILVHGWVAPDGDPSLLAALDLLVAAPEPVPAPASQAPQASLLAAIAGWYRDAKQVAAALPWQRHAREADPTVPGAWQDELDVLAELDRLDDALAVARAARSRFPSEREFASWEAWCLAGLGQTQAARAAYEALLATQEVGADDDRRGYAEVLMDLGQTDAALAQCQRAIADQVASSDTWLLKATLEEEARRYQAALASLEQAARLSPQDEEIRRRRDALRADLGKGGHAAARTPLVAAPVPAGLLPPAPPPEPAPPGAGARYLERVLAIRFEPGRALIETERARVELLDAQGVNAFATWRVPFDPDREDVWVERLRVLDGHGAVVGEGEPDSYYVVADSSTWEASSARVLCAPVPDLAPGRVLEVVTTRAVRSAPGRFGFLRRVLAAEFPVLQGGLVLTGQLAALAWVPSPDVTVHEGHGAIGFLARDLPAWRWEPAQPEGGCWLPRVELGDAGVGWDEVGADYLSDLVEPLTPAPEVAPLVEETLRGVEGHAARVTALYERVRRELTYQAILFGLRAWVPRPTAQVLESRWGDCKEHSLLLWQLLRAAGIEAHLALVSATAPVQPRLAAQDQFDHMIVCVPDPAGGPPRFLDATDEDSPPDLPVPAGLGGRQALVLDPAGARLVQIAPFPPGWSAVALRRSAQADAQGGLVLQDELRLTGRAAGELRGFLRQEPLAQAAVRLQRELLGLGAPVRVSAVEVEGLDELAAPLIVRARLIPRERLRAQDGAWVGRLPCPLARWWLERERAPRSSPLVLGEPLVLRVETSLSGPGGPAALPASDPAETAGRWLSLRSQGDAVRIELAGGEVVAGDVPALLEEIDRALERLEPVVSVP